jgi:asparagine synthase (glutamine-hydrolysing)
MGICGRVGGFGNIQSGLVYLNRGAIRCALDEVRIWNFTGGQMGICCDAQSAVSHAPDTLLILQGRVLNRAEILDELNLQEGKTLNEADLLLRLWLRYRESFPLHADGSYLFAIYEAHPRRMILGSSPAGRGSFYYAEKNGGLRFSSEPGGLLMDPAVSSELNDEEFARLLIRKVENKDRTVYRSIKTIPAGHLLFVEDGKCNLKRYWSLDSLSSIHCADPREYAEGMLAQMQRSVRNSLRSGDAIGSLLSGGLDSTSLSVLAAEMLAAEGRAITAFTSVPGIPTESFDGFITDEGPLAASVAECHPNMEHVRVANNRVELFDVIDRFTNERLIPVLHPANGRWGMAIYAEAQRRGIRTMLSGDGGNNTVSYTGEMALSQLLMQGRMGEWLQLLRDRKKLGLSIRSSIQLSIQHGLAPAWLLDGLRLGLWDPYLRLRGRVKPGAGRLRLFDFSPIHPQFLYSLNLPEEVLEDSRRSIFPFQEKRTTLFLRGRRGIEEFNARCFGLRIVAPLEDRRLAEYCFSIPEEAYCQNGQDRSLIHQAMKGRLPEKVLLERRKGLQSADSTDMLARNREMIIAEFQLVQQSDLANKYMDIAAIQKLIEDWPAGSFSDASLRAIYLQKMLSGVSLGRFLRRLEDGSLLAPLREAARNADISAHRVMNFPG